VSWYQKGKTNLDFTEERDSEWQWHQLGRMQVCISLHTDNHASTPPFKFFTSWMPFLPPNQQRQSTEGSCLAIKTQLINHTGHLQVIWTCWLPYKISSIRTRALSGNRAVHIRIINKMDIKYAL